MNRHPRTNPARLVPLCSLVSFVVVFSSLLGCAGEPKHAAWSNATGAEQYERLMWQAIHDGHWSDFEGHLAPIFVGVNSSGQMFGRDAWVAYWKGAPVKDFSLGEVSVQPQGADMILTYVFHSNQGAWRVVSVWQQVKKGWILTTTSITPLAPMQNSTSANRQPSR